MYNVLVWISIYNISNLNSRRSYHHLRVSQGTESSTLKDDGCAFEEVEAVESPLETGYNIHLSSCM